MVSEPSAIINELLAALQPLQFSLPVTHVYNPLIYARKAHDAYIKRYAHPPIEVMLLGMNPGPWGMAQTGIPFGEIQAVKQWLGIQETVETPEQMHPKRPVTGLACPKSEVSGRRLWDWIANTFKTPERFFERFFVANYCPLLFIEESGRNRTPDKIKIAERKPLLKACNTALQQTVTWLQPKLVVGVGQFARKQAGQALAGYPITIGQITHPSPANPKANRGWDQRVTQEFKMLGIKL
jgi:single-strand selective monofunctional uracil DNA glycosylase